MPTSSNLPKAQAAWRTIQEGRVIAVPHLLYLIFGYGQVDLADIPVTPAELEAAILRFGKIVQEEVGQGDFGAHLRVLVYMLVDNRLPIEWTRFGFTRSDATGWCAARARELYVLVPNDPAAAVAISELPLVSRSDWDAMFEPGAAATVAGGMVEWAEAEYGELSGLQASEEAAQRARRLQLLVDHWHDLEELRFEFPELDEAGYQVYRNLTFTTSGVESLEQRLRPNPRKSRTP